MSNKEQTLLQLEWYREQASKETYDLNKKKMLLGSAENCDIVIDHPTVSSYHAFIVIEDEGGKIVDLESENGIMVNNQMVPSSYFTGNDQILVGDIQLFVEESIVEKPKKGFSRQNILKNPDEAVQKSQVQTQEDVIPAGKPSIEGLTLIDGEYCDIVFQEKNHKPLKENPLSQIDIDYKEGHEQELETFLGDKDIKEDQFQNPIEENPNDKDAIEISVFSMGVLIDHSVVPVKNGEYLFSENKKGKNRIQLDFLPHEKEASESQKAGYEVPFLHYKEGSYQLLPVPGMELIEIRNETESTDEGLETKGAQTIKQGQTFVYRYGTVEVFVTAKKAAPELAAPPLFQWDPRLKKISLKVYSGLLSIMLLLLFINTTEEVDKKKEMAIIYKPAKVKGERNPQKTAPVTANKDKEQGVQKKEISKKKPKLAKSSTKIKKVKKKPKKVKKVAKAPRKKLKKKAAPPKKKHFKIAATGKLNKLFKKNNVKIEAKRDSSSTSSSSSSAATSTSTASASASSNKIARLGSNSRGSAKASAGARGLASKRGASSAYMEPKTVILGSMDPDLLRKILREYLPQFRHCYQQELERQNKKLKGVLDLNFDIRGNGAVANIDIELRRARFSSRGVNCMSNVLRMIPFPKPKGGGIVQVRQPLNFFAQKSKI